MPDFGQAQGNQLTVAVAAGVLSPFFDQMTARKVWASMDRRASSQYSLSGSLALLIRAPSQA
ncbi:hypothetical protein IV498_17795 [Paenarthrobacter sp. Z7-10]|nr:hypothetical protein [Paenarthrobacter sp. Z7-10]MCZ2404963.1 hypothetical protein [Paenarthrobacter sp. Z7-10]